MNPVNTNLSFGTALREFHEDEGGMEAIQTIVILAVAALVMIGVHFIWKTANLGKGNTGVLGVVTSLAKELFKLKFK